MASAGVETGSKMLGVIERCLVSWGVGHPPADNRQRPGPLLLDLGPTELGGHEPKGPMDGRGGLRHALPVKSRSECVLLLLIVVSLLPVSDRGAYAAPAEKQAQAVQTQSPVQTPAPAPSAPAPAPTAPQQ